MAKDEEVEWRRMRRLNGEGSEKTVINRFIIIIIVSRPEIRNKERRY